MEEKVVRFFVPLVHSVRYFFGLRCQDKKLYIFIGTGSLGRYRNL